MKTAWLIFGCGVFGVVYLIASLVFLISIRNNVRKSALLALWNRNTNKLSPGGVNGFQLGVWRISVLARWFGGVFGVMFIIIELAFLIFGA